MNSFSAKAAFALLICSCLAGHFPAGAASVHYSTGFEPPQFATGAFGIAPGSLATQSPNWSLFANGNGADLTNEVRVQNSQVRSGTKALQINAAFANGVQSGVSTGFENAEPLVRIQADIFLFPSTIQTAWQFAAIDSGGFVGGFNIIPDDGRFQLITGGFPQTGPIISRGVWNHYEMNFNLLTQTYQVLINEAPVATNIPFLATASQLRGFQFATFAGGNDSAALDNFSFTATPEPSTTVLLGGAAFAFAATRRRNLYH